MTLKIKETSNYEMFDLHEMNRRVEPHKKDYKRLVESMKKYGFKPEKHINCTINGCGKLKIKEGHNRFTAAKELNIPVKYMIVDDDIDICELEQAGPGKWKAKDYLYSYARRGEKDYEILENYIEATGISPRDAASMLSGEQAGGGNYRKNNKFEKGEFKIKESGALHAATVASLTRFLKETAKINWAHYTLMVKALSHVLLTPGFDENRFRDKVEKYPYLVKKQRNVDDYLEMLQTVYNYKVGSKNYFSVKEEAKKAAVKRNPAKKYMLK